MLTSISEHEPLIDVGMYDRDDATLSGVSYSCVGLVDKWMHYCIAVRYITLQFTAFHALHVRSTLHHNLLYNIIFTL